VLLVNNTESVLYYTINALVTLIDFGSFCTIAYYKLDLENIVAFKIQF